MTKLTITLPQGYRLYLGLAKTRSSALLVQKRVSELPFIPSLALLRRFPQGNPISKFFRHIFEHQKINKILGSNLALAVIASSIIQLPTYASNVPEVEDMPLIIKSEKVNLLTQKGIQLPLKNYKLNQSYFFFHPGVDLDGETGDPVLPIMTGKVESIQHSRFAYGNAVIVNHGNGITSLYAHLSKIEVEPGDEVSLNTEIGQVGSTGRSSGDHLHLEIKEEGRPMNPLSVLPR